MWECKNTWNVVITKPMKGEYCVLIVGNYTYPMLYSSKEQLEKDIERALVYRAEYAKDAKATQEDILTAMHEVTRLDKNCLDWSERASIAIAKLNALHAKLFKENAEIKGRTILTSDINPNQQVDITQGKTKVLSLAEWLNASDYGWFHMDIPLPKGPKTK